MKTAKVEKLVTNFYDKHEYVIHIRVLKQVLNHGLVVKKDHRVIKFIQKASLKPYIDINTDLRKKFKKMILRKTFLKKPWKMLENTEISNL